MFKIDSDGATIDNLFTEGNPATSVPATVVSADWLNEIQGELVKVVEETGQTLTKGSKDQVWKAMIEFALRGGRKTPIIQSLSNNSGPLDVVGFEFDSANIVGKVGFYHIERKTDTQNKQEMGLVFIRWDSADSDWAVSFQSFFDDAGVTLSTAVESGSNHKLQYTTDDLTGTTYSGTMTITSIFELRNS